MGMSMSPEADIKVQMGGKRKKGNGHKPNCGCPICKNCRKSGKSKKVYKGRGPMESEEMKYSEEMEPEMGPEIESMEYEMEEKTGGRRRRRKTKKNSKRKTRKSHSRKHRKGSKRH